MPIFRPLASIVWEENEVTDRRTRDVMHIDTYIKFLNSGMDKEYVQFLLKNAKPFLSNNTTTLQLLHLRQTHTLFLTPLNPPSVLKLET